MHTTQQFSISLPSEADPVRAITVDQVRATLAAEHKKSTAKSK